MLALRKSMSSGVPQKSKNRKHPPPTPPVDVELWCGALLVSDASSSSSSSSSSKRSSSSSSNSSSCTSSSNKNNCSTT